MEAIAKIRHTSHDAQRLARLHVIAGAGHSAYFERPEAFNAAVMDFLTDVP